MGRIYLDNAATTQMDKEVIAAMLPYMHDFFGNPSSTHEEGKRARKEVENARETIATLLNASPEEIYFTSGGTEGNNTAIFSTVRSLGIKHVITSKLEHHAVLNPLEALKKNGEIKLSFVDTDKQGNIDLKNLEDLLADNTQTLVSLMHGNNEVGNLNDIELIAEISRYYNAINHSDTVQTIGHYKYNLQHLKADFIVSTAHKYHGPKGVGFIYANKNTKVTPLLYGGSQERGLRSGTENVSGIVGIAKALEIAYRNLEAHQKHIRQLKERMIAKLSFEIPGLEFNGNSANLKKSINTVLSISLPPVDSSISLLNHLNENQIAASGGSACTSGSKSSHVLQALCCSPERTAVRFSFSKYNTPEEIDYAVETLASVYSYQL